MKRSARKNFIFLMYYSLMGAFMPYCPKCGVGVEEGAVHCPNCGVRLERDVGAASPSRYGDDVRAMGHLSLAFNLAAAKPMVFAPAVIGAIINLLIRRISDLLLGPIQWSIWQGDPLALTAYSGTFAAAAVLSIIGGVIVYVLNFASIDMSRDAYEDKPLDLMGSVNYVLRRIGIFILASIVGFLMAITIILIPVVIFMFVIIVMDEAGIRAAISRAFSVLGSDLGDVVVVIIVAIVGSIILGFIPLIGGLLTTLLNVVIGLAFMDIYYRYKQSRY